MKVNVVKKVLNANDVVAAENRKIFEKAKVLAVNIISSPGSGKTTLLEKTIPALEQAESVVLVGDLQTTRDADRIAPYARSVTQINTGMSCHLYANQVAQALGSIELDGADFLFIENVGNLVCPGEFDLGENVKVALLSVPEGDDKVAKYPTVFRAVDIVLLTKSDLLGKLNFDLARVKDDLAKLNENVTFIELSSLQGDGMDKWLQWLNEQRSKSIGIKARTVTEEA